MDEQVWQQIIIKGLEVMGVVGGTSGFWVWRNRRNNNKGNGTHSAPCNALQSLRETVKVHEAKSEGNRELIEEKVGHINDAIVDMKSDMKELSDTQKKILLGIQKMNGGH